VRGDGGVRGIPLVQPGNRLADFRLRGHPDVHRQFEQQPDRMERRGILRIGRGHDHPVRLDSQWQDAGLFQPAGADLADRLGRPVIGAHQRQGQDVGQGFGDDGLRCDAQADDGRCQPDAAFGGGAPGAI
jgi:hypothetical protein